MPRYRVALLFPFFLFALLGCAPQPSAQEDQAALAEESRARLAQIEGSIVLEGLDQPVEVLRDKWGVAHIYAQSVADLFFTQGFVAAQDRLYQIEIWRRTGSGELAEVFGPSYVERDRIARLVRYRGDMQAEWESYSPDTRAIAEAFTSGVNAFVQHAAGRLPIEFELLDFEPGEWKPEDTLLRIAGLLMTRNARQEVARAEMIQKLGLEATMKYIPTDPHRELKPDPEVDLSGIDPSVLDGYRNAVSIPTLYGEDGSNNWVVDGTLSSTGKPLLASDPHRPVILPSLRYMVHLVGPGWNVIGSGEPALPGVAIGHNERVGWGFTIVQYDQVDLFIEKTDPEDPNRYLYRGDWLDMNIEREEIRVKGQSEPAEVELKFTRHGPVIWEDEASQRAVALRWSGAEPGTAGYLGSLAIDRVENWDDFVEAMARWKLPSENIVYADVDGDIGWIPAGLMPIRKNWSGLLPVPGHTGKYEWSGSRTIDELPRIHNPGQHYVATANHNIRPENYPHDLGFDWSAPYRFRRVDKVLSEGKKFTIEDFQRLQHDEVSIPGRQLLELFKQTPRGGSVRVQQARMLLEAWDGVLGKDSAGAALFEVWFKELAPRFVASQIAEPQRQLVERNLQLPVLIRLLKGLPEVDRNSILADSFDTAVAEAGRLLGGDMSSWKWGTLHTITFQHPLADSPAREALFNLGPVERGGDGNTPNATRGPGFTQSNGASYRHILDLADWDRSVFTSTPGQSGQPGSPHYDDLLPLWAKHEYAPMVFTREAVEENTANTLRLEPR